MQRTVVTIDSPAPGEQTAFAERLREAGFLVSFGPPDPAGLVVTPDLRAWTLRGADAGRVELEQPVGPADLASATRLVARVQDLRRELPRGLASEVVIATLLLQKARRELAPMREAAARLGRSPNGSANELAARLARGTVHLKVLLDLLLAAQSGVERSGE